MSIIRSPILSTPVDVEEEPSFIHTEAYADPLYPESSMWPPGHQECNPFYCSPDNYHYHHILSHVEGEHPGATTYYLYLALQDPSRLLPQDPSSLEHDLRRMTSLCRAQILALRAAFRLYRAGRAPRTIPQPSPRLLFAWDDPSGEDSENVPPLQDWNFDPVSALYYP